MEKEKFFILVDIESTLIDKNLEGSKINQENIESINMITKFINSMFEPHLVLLSSENIDINTAISNLKKANLYIPKMFRAIKLPEEDMARTEALLQFLIDNKCHNHYLICEDYKREYDAYIPKRNVINDCKNVKKALKKTIETCNRCL